MKKIALICSLLFFSITHASEELLKFTLRAPQNTPIQEKGYLELTTSQREYASFVEIKIGSNEAAYALCALAIESLANQIPKTPGLNRMTITGAKRGPNKGTLALKVKLEGEKDTFYRVNLLSAPLLAEQIDPSADSA